MGNTRITEIEVGYLSEPEGTVDMGTKWAIKRDKRAGDTKGIFFPNILQAIQINFMLI